MARPHQNRAPETHAADAWKDPEAAALVRALQREAHEGRLFWDGGPTAQQLSKRAFIVLAVHPLCAAFAWCRARLRTALGEIRGRVGASSASDPEGVARPHRVDRL